MSEFETIEPSTEGVKILQLSPWGDFYLIRLFNDLESLNFAKTYVGKSWALEGESLTQAEMVSLSQRAIVDDFRMVHELDGEKGLEAARATVNMNLKLQEAA